MKDKTRLLITKVFGVVMVLGIVFFLAGVFIYESAGGMSLIDMMLLLAPAILVIAVLIMFLRRMDRGVKAGLPLDDEMSKRLKERAGYLTFVITIWFMIGLVWYNGFIVDMGFPEIATRYMPMITLLFMLAVFGVIWLLISRRGIK